MCYIFLLGCFTIALCSLVVRQCYLYYTEVYLKVEYIAPPREILSSALSPARIEGFENETSTSSTATTATDPATTATDPATTATTTPYKEYDATDPLILGQQNAGNIAYLKERIAAMDAIDARTKTQQQQLDGLQEQVNSLTAQQAQYASDLVGDEPIELQGMDVDMTGTGTNGTGTNGIGTTESGSGEVDINDE